MEQSLVASLKSKPPTDEQKASLREVIRFCNAEAEARRRAAFGYRMDAPYWPFALDSPTMTTAFFSQNGEDWGETLVVSAAMFAFGAASARGLGLGYVTPVRLGSFLGITAGILGVNAGMQRSAQRLIGVRPNGTGLRPGFDDYERWENVPPVVKHRAPDDRADLPEWTSPAYVCKELMAHITAKKKAAAELEE